MNSSQYLNLEDDCKKGLACLTVKALISSIILVFVTCLCWPAPPVHAQSTDPPCTVSILNQTAYVQDDGTWLIPNVPSNMGLVRARVTCIENGVTVTGESDLFEIKTELQNSIPPVPLVPPSPAPVRLVLESPRTTLDAVGDSVALTAHAELVDGTARDVTAAAAGITYISSNPNVATVDADGVVRATASGRILITALYDSTIDTLFLEVIASGDSDGDGLPDDLEIRLGLDPNDPIDALEDPDRDGLASFEEVELGLDPNTADTDGDGLSDFEEVRMFGSNGLLVDTDGDGFYDGLEIELGTDPLDPMSFDLAQALESFEVTPTRAVVIVNTVTPVASRQLTVTGTLIDGNPIDLTPRARGTQYASSDLLVCNFGIEDGLIFATNDGDCMVTVSNSGFSVLVDMTVVSFAPIARSTIDLPGYANNVAVEGSTAYVAAGSAGLHIVDVHDRTDPRLLSTFTTANANDVKVRGTLAYLALGSNGFMVLDVANPSSPSLAGALITPGIARDVALHGDFAYVAVGPAGLAILDISDPVRLRMVGSLAFSSDVKAVDVSAEGQLAFVVDQSVGLHVIDVSNPGIPTVLGLSSSSSALEVEADGSTVWVAEHGFGLRTVDVSNPSAPRELVRVSNPEGGAPTGITRVDVPTSTGNVPLGGSKGGKDSDQGDGEPLVFLSDTFFFNGVPILGASDPADPRRREFVDFAVFGDLAGTGLDVDDDYVYLTAATQFVEDGQNGSSKLLIAQYLGLEDTAGEAPEVFLASPEPGTEVPESGALRMQATAKDDVGVFQVRFLIDGEVVFIDDNPPYLAEVAPPPAPATITVSALALDFGGTQAETEAVIVEVTKQLTTSVVGAVKDLGGAAVEGAGVVTSVGGNASTDAGGFFRFDDLPADQGEITAQASTQVGGVKLLGRSAPVAPVVGGFTDVGDVVLEPLGEIFTGRKFPLYELGEMESPRGPDVMTRGDFNGDGIDDWAGAGIGFSRMGVILGLGGGLYESARFLGELRSVTRLVAADLNEDGHDDLVAAHITNDLIGVHRSLGNGFFAEVSYLATGDQPNDIVIADFDVDGHLDIAVSNGNTDDVSVFLGRGDATFAPEVRYAAPPAPRGLAAEDVDFDGRLDLVVGQSSITEALVLFGQGDGTFDGSRAIETGLKAVRLSMVDVDSDGFRDLVVTGRPLSSSRVRMSVTRARGDGTFAGPVISSVDQFANHRFADFDGDGLLDLAGLEEELDGDVIVIYAGDSSLFFTRNRSVAAPAGSVDAFEVADADGDGVLDLVAGGAGGIKILRGTSSLAFRSYQKILRASGVNGSYAAVDDFNGDGLMDIAQTGSDIGIHPGLPEGGFGPPIAFDAVHTAHGIFTADLDLNGWPDVLTWTFGSVAAYMNRGAAAFDPAVESLTPSLRPNGALGDLDGDGFPDAVFLSGATASLVVLRNQGDGTFLLWQTPEIGNSPQDVHLADLDGNGFLDIVVTALRTFDLAVLLNRGGGNLEPLALVPAGGESRRLTDLDADGDGHRDLAVELSSIRKIRILHGQGDGRTFTGGELLPSDSLIRVRAVDFDLDGVVDLVSESLSDHILLYLGQGEGSFAPPRLYVNGNINMALGDLDNDGRPDVVEKGPRDLHILIQE